MDPRPNQHQLLSFEKESKQRKLPKSFSLLTVFFNDKYYIRFPHFVKNFFIKVPFFLLLKVSGDPYGNRTHVCGVRGRRLNRLTNGPHRRHMLHPGEFSLSGVTHTQEGVVHLQGLEPWTP